MQCLETEAIEEEGKDHLSFLTACETALQASPPEACGVLMPLFHLFMGNAPLATLLNIPPRYPPLNMNLPYWSLTLLPPWHCGPCPAELYPCLDQKALLEGSLRNHPT